jgi:hypothetical protein
MKSKTAKRKVFYITLNDAPGGIFQSQVIDVIKLYRDQKIDANLIALISIRGFFKQRRKIKDLLSASVVLPSFPKLKFWNLNRFWFAFLRIPKNSIIIARNIFACNLVLNSAASICTVIYDGRGAIAAEQEEYNVYAGTGLEDKIEQLEKRAIFLSAKKIAVSKKLLEYWREHFNYSGEDSIVIPCTSSNDFSREKDKNRVQELQEEMSIDKDTITFVYSGSIAEWQSFGKIKGVLLSLLESNPRSKLIFLAKEHAIINSLITQFPNRVFQKFVDHSDVVNFLDLCDYGLLLREDSITNKVASPVKCAEYLSRGLKVLISPNIGDYSEEVKLNELGYIVEMDEKSLILGKVDRKKQIDFAQLNLMKTSEKVIDKYMELLSE